MTGQDSFREALLRRIEIYRETEKKIRARFDELASELEATQGRREAAEKLFAAEFEALPVEPRAIGPRRGLLNDAQQQPDGPYTGLSWENAISRVLAVDGPLHVKEIWDRLDAGGFHTHSQDPVRSIVAMSIRSPRIVRAAPNTYTLVEGSVSAYSAEGKR